MSQYRKYDEALESGIAFREIGQNIFTEKSVFYKTFQLQVIPEHRKREISN